MKSSSRKLSWVSVLALGLMVWFVVPPRAAAQQGSSQAQPPPKPAAGQTQQPGQAAPPAAPAEAPKLDPQEEAAYKVFYDLKGEDIDRLIRTGEDFLKKYPQSHYSEVVYSRLTTAYFTKNELDKMTAAGDKALGLNPDDVVVLSLVGWVLPHNYDPNDLDAEHKLIKAERYSKHALEVLATMPKPAALSDAEFAKAKNDALSRSHSGLGLVYFRREQFAESVPELQQATQLISPPEATDFFVMGIDLQQLKRFSDAVAAFEQCSKIPGPLQERCKQQMEQAKKLAASQPAAKP